MVIQISWPKNSDKRWWPNYGDKNMTKRRWPKMWWKEDVEKYGDRTIVPSDLLSKHKHIMISQKCNSRVNWLMFTSSVIINQTWVQWCYNILLLLLLLFPNSVYVHNSQLPYRKKHYSSTLATWHFVYLTGDDHAGHAKEESRDEGSWHVAGDDTQSTHSHQHLKYKENQHLHSSHQL